MSKYNKSKSKERYVILRYWMLQSPAWQSLPGGARALYVEIAQRYNGSNNGRVPYSVREAKQALHISHHTGRRWLRILQDRGFIVCTKHGAFSLKTTKDASEWALTEYASDHPPAYPTKDFMKWRPPEGLEINILNQQPSHRRNSKTRRPPRLRTVAPTAPYGGPHGSVSSKNRLPGIGSVASTALGSPEHAGGGGHSTGTPEVRVTLPDGVEDSEPVATANGAPHKKLPWPTTPPTVTEVPFDNLSTELRMMALELSGVGGMPQATGDISTVDTRTDTNGAQHQAPTEEQLDAVADVPGPAEKSPPAADVIDEAEKAKQEADQLISAPDPAPALPMLPGDRRRAETLARNQEALRRFEAQIRRGP